MFFKAAVFKRLITQAWKGIGLTAGKDGKTIQDFETRFLTEDSQMTIFDFLER